MGKYVQFIAKIREKGAAIDLREVSFGAGSFPDTGDMKEFIGDKKEMLADLHSRFKGFTPNVLKILSTHYSEKSYKGNDYSQYKDNLSE